MPAKKIVYLFGAGATHAEIFNLKPNPDAIYRDKNGLLISDVSKRVMREAQKIKNFKKDVEFVTAAEGSLNIELLISLLLTNQIPNSDSKAKELKRLVKQDIVGKLRSERRKRFCLHKGLFELHALIKNREELIGSISLNYDSVLDEAYAANGLVVSYCHSSDVIKGLPLLKLHGSFNWKSIDMYGKRKQIPIIPLGVRKNYLIPPYNFIWGKAYELLVACDVLRIIGCSMNQNDLGLVDLLFKVHLERRDPLEMQIIDFQTNGDAIKNSYGFFPNIVKPKDIEDSLIADERIMNPENGGNPFKLWLQAKALKTVEKPIRKTKFLRECF